MRNSFCDKFLTVKFYSIGILVVNLLPQGLELFLSKVFVERVIFDLGFVTVRDHLLNHTVIVYGLNESMDALGHRPQFFGKRSNGVHLHIGAILICNLAFHINIAIRYEVEFDSICLVLVDDRGYIIDLNILAFEILACGCSGSIVENSFDI